MAQKPKTGRGKNAVSGPPFSEATLRTHPELSVKLLPPAQDMNSRLYSHVISTPHLGTRFTIRSDTSRGSSPYPSKIQVFSCFMGFSTVFKSQNMGATLVTHHYGCTLGYFVNQLCTASSKIDSGLVMRHFQGGLCSDQESTCAQIDERGNICGHSARGID
jgi:hypothetical protein